MNAGMDSYTGVGDPPDYSGKGPRGLESLKRNFEGTFCTCQEDTRSSQCFGELKASDPWAPPIVTYFPKIWTPIGSLNIFTAQTFGPEANPGRAFLK